MSPDPTRYRSRPIAELSDEELEREKLRVASDHAESPIQERGRTPTLLHLDTVTPSSVEWLWHPYLPLGKLVVLSGDPDVGKTWLGLAICSMVTTGNFSGVDAPNGSPANCMFLTAEDGLDDTIVPRLDMLGADRARVTTITGWTHHSDTGEVEEGPVELGDLEILQKAVEQVRPRFVFVDPLQAFLGASVDMHRSNETRPVLARLAQLAADYELCCVLNRHLRKSADAKAIYRGLGSIDFTAAARSELVAARDPEASSTEAKFILAHSKSNLAPRGRAMRYELQPNLFVWSGACDLTADMLVAPPEQQADLQPSARDEARGFLLEELRERPVLSRDVRRQARGVGISDSTLDRAKREIGFRAFKDQEQWYWPRLAVDDGGAIHAYHDAAGDAVGNVDALDAAASLDAE